MPLMLVLRGPYVDLFCPHYCENTLKIPKDPTLLCLYNVHFNFVLPFFVGFQRSLCRYWTLLVEWFMFVLFVAVFFHVFFVVVS